jgi:uncharacterized LabA/DUF88 family protein
VSGKAAIFVDAGYLLAASAELITGSPSRGGIEVGYSALVSTLIRFAEHHSGLPVLRMYWYDGARNAVPTQEQLTIARLPQVKVRLGRRTRSGQKGVDSLIVHDLMVLARERAMARAYLLSGDEDIREGAAAAQQMGVSVVLLGIPARTQQSNQADSLIREADDHLIMDRAVVIDPHVRPAGTRRAAANPPAVRCASPRASGNAFGLSWLAKASPAEAAVLRGQSPRIPRELDAELLHAAEVMHGPLRGNQEGRQALRAGFWDAVMNNAPVGTPIATADEPAPHSAAGSLAADRQTLAEFLRTSPLPGSGLKVGRG